MPISPENRNRYPANWKQISNRVRFERADGRCECKGECGHDHGGRCTASHNAAHPDTGSLVILTVAHIDHQPENCGADNLRAMCQRCHLRYDVEHHRETRRNRKAAGDLFAECIA